MRRRWIGWTSWALGALLVNALASVVLAQSDRSLQRAPDQNENRWALVIGNADYTSGRLRNPGHDALAMARLLGGLGFQVDLRQNVDRRGMEGAIRTFGQNLNRGGVGIFYFAGHGVQLQGSNYLIPVDSNIRSERDVKYRAVNLGFLLEKMGEAKNGLNIVILDACRDNPFDEFHMPLQGLAQTSAPRGTILAYATAPGTVAADGSGRHGLFTEHLLSTLNVPGWTIETIFKRTREAVVEITQGSQVPWTASSLVGEFVPRTADGTLSASTPDTSTSDISRPGISDFSIEDLESRAEAIEAGRRAWSDRLREMKVAFGKSVSYEDRDVPAELKAEVWQRFLSGFAEDDPYTEDDDALRARAVRKVERWRQDVESAAPVPKPPPPATLVFPEPTIQQPTIPAREPGDLWEESVLGMRFRYIPAGRFRMGSPTSELGHKSDEKPHLVTLTRGFWMGETEVTQGQWEAVIGNQPSRFQDCGENCPVEQMTWYGALAYANVLSKHSGFEECYELSDCNDETLGDGLECEEVKSRGPRCSGYRLPTEAEWEYAARAGTTTAFWTGDSLTTGQANFNGNRLFARPVPGQYRKTTTPVGTFEANPWGLYDVHGNVREWVWDGYDSYSNAGETDPTGPEEAESHVFRGGGWFDRIRSCRSASRKEETPIDRDDDVGFRLVRTSE